jgi:hypothetical protein
MKDLIKKTRKANILFNALLVCMLFACNDDAIFLESKRDYMQRVFSEETRMQQYYTQKILDTTDSLNIELMNVYVDSAKMANYCSIRAYSDMRDR